MNYPNAYESIFWDVNFLHFGRGAIFVEHRILALTLEKVDCLNEKLSAGAYYFEDMLYLYT